jgi:hypothetical protein
VTHYRLNSLESNPGGQYPPPSSDEIKKRYSYTSTPLSGPSWPDTGELYLLFLLFINYYCYYLLIYFICGRKQLGHEADHSLQPSGESTNEFNCTSKPAYAFLVLSFT